MDRGERKCKDCKHHSEERNKVFAAYFLCNKLSKDGAETYTIDDSYCKFWEERRRDAVSEMRR